jgi:hypothetical protein
MRSRCEWVSVAGPAAPGFADECGIRCQRVDKLVMAAGMSRFCRTGPVRSVLLLEVLLMSVGGDSNRRRPGVE